MSTVLADQLFDRLVAENAPDTLIDLVLAAADSDDALAGVVGGSVAARPSRKSAHVDAGPVADGVYLSELKVEGFRGIGPEAVLQLDPGPGLTIITGRNGSGKSSFAEALEVVLTGSAERFRRHAAWKEGWRNVHSTTPPRLRLAVHLPGHKGTTAIERSWPGTDLDLSDATAQSPGEKRTPLDALGWGGPLQQLRPFLTHAEVESLLESKPSDLHDRLGTVLGLEAMEATIERLARHSKGAGDRSKAVTQAKTALRSLLSGIDDPRAVEAARLLGKRPVPLGDVAALAVGAGVPDPAIERLQALAAVPPIDLGVHGSAAAALRSAGSALQSLDSPELRVAQETADLLTHALQLHAHTGDEVCRVCGTVGVIDEQWRQQALRRSEDLAASAAQLRGAVANSEAALASMQRLTLRPAAFSAPTDDVDTSDLAAAWDELEMAVSHLKTGPDLIGAADRIEGIVLGLEALQRDAIEAARAELDRREAAWQRVAAQVATWVESARVVEAESAALASIENALDWCKATLVTMRNERLDPIRLRARELWSMLRQQSNVSLADIRFEGTATRRKVTFDVLVDDSGAQALGVMSQGELNALALAVFLPRATQAESPFRFVVIDDPVQAMDPSKVNGLARVLEQVAIDRQVVVLTHDPRLVDAVEHLGINARILTVDRKAGSVVTITPHRDPGERALSDARAVLKDPQIPDAVKTTVVSNLCRQALESHLAVLHRRRALNRGDAHDTVEDDLRSASGAYLLAALALLGDSTLTGDVLTTLNRRYGSRAADVFRHLNAVGHIGSKSVDDLRTLISDTDWLIKTLGTVGK